MGNDSRSHGGGGRFRYFILVLHHLTFNLAVAIFSGSGMRYLLLGGISNSQENRDCNLSPE